MSKFFIDASNAANLKKALAKFPASLFNQARGALADELEPFRQQMVKRSSLPPGPIPEGQGVHKQSGRFAGKWGVVTKGDNIGNLQGRVKNYAAVQGPLLEEGGSVDVPRGSGPTGGWIFIPTDLNKRASGEAIQSPGLVLQSLGFFVNRHRKRWANFPAAAKSKLLPSRWQTSPSAY